MERRQHGGLDFFEGFELLVTANVVRTDIGAGEVLALEPFGEGEGRRGGGIEFAAAKGLRRELHLGLLCVGIRDGGGCCVLQLLDGLLQVGQGLAIVAVDAPEKKADGEDDDEGENGFEPQDRHGG